FGWEREGRRGRGATLRQHHRRAGRRHDEDVHPRRIEQRAGQLEGAAQRIDDRPWVVRQAVSFAKSVERGHRGIAELLGSWYQARLVAYGLGAEPDMSLS